MKKKYKIVIMPFLKEEQIIYRQQLKGALLKKLVNKKYLIFSYNRYLDSYILIGCNFSLRNLQHKLNSYFESYVLRNE